MTAEIVNLNKFRKAKQREDDQQRAAENREKYGRSKEQRLKEDDDQARRDALLDGSKREAADDQDLDPGTVS